MASQTNPHSTTTPPLPSQQRPQQHNGTSRPTGSSSRADNPSPSLRPERRSSTISLDSFKDSTSDMWLPRPKVGRKPSGERSDDGGSNWASAPLAFALLPAIGGMLFKNGSQVVSDILLLALAAVFLNWSVRLPWDWYRSAQELRVQDAALHDGVRDFEDGDISDSGTEDAKHIYPFGDLNYEVPTQEDVKNGTLPSQPSPHNKPTPRSARKLRQIQDYETSRKELYRHELLALLCCFLFPIAGAYLLHTIRDSLSRPSEGLVSNYNLTIFLLAAELRPMSHLVKLVQARTLHLQRVVKDNPYQSVDEQQNQDISDIRDKISELEKRVQAAPLQTPGPLPGEAGKERTVDEKSMAVIGANVRRQLQPELDALNRAVRRYEKRAALQAMQTESRLLDLDARLGDAISLAAAAAKGSQTKSSVATVIEWAGAGMLLPWQIAGSIIQVPYGIIKSILGFVGVAGRKVNPGRDVNVRVDVGRRKSSMKGGREAERFMKASASTVR